MPLWIQFPCPPPGDHRYAFCHDRLVLSVLEPNVSGMVIFCVWLLSHSIRLLPVPGVHSLLLSKSLSYGYSMVCLFIYLCLDFWVVSSIWLLWMKLLGTLLYRLMASQVNHLPNPVVQVQFKIGPFIHWAHMYKYVLNPFHVLDRQGSALQGCTWKPT